jgi:hypothetical protein
MKVTELRELCISNTTLMLWAEEAAYLHAKGLVDGSKVKVDLSLASFYSKERDEGKLMTRNSQPTYEELESQQRFKVNPEAEQSPKQLMKFDSYQDRANF